ncbi:hypothetical protein PV04_08737 [Phialophora macrospora]|uniref:Uncharacterized protein n=1 Tax=Phialophora macrospora TaxID=1851006 RepID=A0A0D2FUK9_9EURO|nr:hypothetical protein PV04_08737 [Phialophora macrospora]
MPFNGNGNIISELTRLFDSLQRLPVTAILKHWNLIQASGSDPMAEMILTSLFGTPRIDANLESSFVTRVSQTKYKILGILPISIEQGAGPTVRQALIHRGECLPALIQLSLLVAVHGDRLRPLARDLIDIRRERSRRRSEEVEDQFVLGYDATLGTLEAYRDQTNKFGWYHFLEDVRSRIGLDYEREYHRSDHTSFLRSLAIPGELIGCLLEHLTKLQRMHDHYIEIETMQGVPTIVVWAHHILMLCVHVVVQNQYGFQEKKIFGVGKPRVIIHAYSSDSSREKEFMFRYFEKHHQRIEISPVRLREEQPLESPWIGRLPLENYGLRTIENQLKARGYDFSDMEMKEIAKVAGLAVLHHSINLFGRNIDQSVERATASEPVPAPPRRSPFCDWDQVQNVLGYFFNTPPMSREEAFRCIPQLDVPTLGLPDFRLSFKLKGNSCIATMRQGFNAAVHIELTGLAVLLAAFSCVDNLIDHANLMIPESLGRQVGFALSPNHPGGYFMAGESRGWENKTLLAFFTHVLRGVGPDWKELNRTWLVSDMGWSVYLPIAFETCDPCMVDRYRIALENGTPVVNGERRKKIVDGLHRSTFERTARPKPLPPAFDMARDLSETKVAREWVSTDHDAFSVAIQLDSLWGSCTTGYSELYDAATRQSWTEVSCICRGADEPTRFPERFYLFQGLYKYSLSGQNPEVHLLPVAGNVWARYLCLLAAGTTGDLGAKRCYVRGNRACNQCWLTALTRGAEGVASDRPEVAIWVVL